MASLPNSVITQSQIQQQIGAMIPLGQISSVVQTLQNIKGFNAGSFSQLTNTIQSALQGFDQASSIIQNFSGNSPVAAFTNVLSSTGMAGTSISRIANQAAGAFRQADSFLSTIGQVQSFARLSSRRPTVEEAREANLVAGGTLQFPMDIGKYWISLQFEMANFTSIMASKNVVSSFQRKNGGGVILPPPINLVDSNNLEYTPIKLGNIGLDAVLGVAGEMKALQGMLKDIAAPLASAGIETAGALTGYALNTHQTLKFVQPSLKKHTFTWKLVPSTPQESKAIEKIVKFIKSKIYPTSDFQNLAFKYPHLVNVVLYNGGKMYLFKPAYVESFSVNYTTEGGPAFHKDDYPVAVQIDMSITENAVWLAGDNF